MDEETATVGTQTSTRSRQHPTLRKDDPRKRREAKKEQKRGELTHNCILRDFPKEKGCNVTKAHADTYSIY